MYHLAGVLFLCCRNLLSRGTNQRLLPKAARLCRVPDDQEGIETRLQRRVHKWAVLRAVEEQEAEILFWMHWWVFVCGRGWEGGEVWLYKVPFLNVPHLPHLSCFVFWKTLYTYWPCRTNKYFIAEIFEIYCKIQNRLIFIMKIKTFFSTCNKKKNPVFELRLLVTKRSFEENKNKDLVTLQQFWEILTAF